MTLRVTLLKQPVHQEPVQLEVHFRRLYLQNLNQRYKKHVTYDLKINFRSSLDSTQKLIGD